MQKKILPFLLALAFTCTVFTAQSFAKDTVIKTAWLAEHETFLIWYAKEKGWDKQLGYDIELMPFDSGLSILDGKKADKWEIASLGAAPLITSKVDNDLTIIAIANNESRANAIYVPRGSRIVEVEGYNPSFDDVAGHPEFVKGKRLLTSEGSSSHLTLVAWLKALGINSKKEQIQFMKQGEQDSAMQNGYGDVFSLWSPATFQAENLDMVKVATAQNLHLVLPIVIVADTQFAKANPKKVEAFLKIYTKTLNEMNTGSLEDFVSDYIRFAKEWSGITLTHNEALLDLENHPMFSVENQIEFLENDGLLSDWLKTLTDIAVQAGIIDSSKDAQTVLINNSFLKAIN